jgi:hypothetical protein
MLLSQAPQRTSLTCEEEMMLTTRQSQCSDRSRSVLTRTPRQRPRWFIFEVRAGNPMFERKNEKLVPLPRFVQRVALSLVLAFVVLCVALCIGILGYHGLAGLSWIDSILNASMILTGMGPVATMTTTTSKLFASGYALFSGIVFLSSIGLVLSPIIHRILHKFHFDDAEQDQKKTPKTD